MKEDILEKELELYKNTQIGKIEDITIVSLGTNNKHDKIIKEILSDEEEVEYLLKRYLKLEVKGEKLEKYKNSFITEELYNKESDVIYKQTDKGVYYIIEHQSTVDKSMPRRILEYSVELLREVSKNTKDEENPVIVPIVIYTGKRKWKVENNFKNTQKTDEEAYKKYKISYKYELIDINQYAKERIIEENTKLSYLMLLEKDEESIEIKRRIKELMEKADTEEKIKCLRKIIIFILDDVLEVQEREELLEMIREKEKGELDEWIARVKRNDKARLDNAKKEGVKLGIREAVLKMVKNMLKSNLSDDNILQYTQIKPRELEQIKRELKAKA